MAIEQSEKHVCIYIYIYVTYMYAYRPILQKWKFCMSLADGAALEKYICTTCLN